MQETQKREPSVRMSSPPGAVVAMLERFFHYFGAQNFGAAAELWDLPALVLGDGHVHGPMSRPHLERLLAEAVPRAQSTALAGQRPRGGARGEAATRIESAEWLAGRVAQVCARWPEQRFGGFLEGVDSTTFLVRVDEATDPKIRGVVLLPEGYPEPFSP